MARRKTTSGYIAELKKMIKSRTGADYEPWLLPMINKTASNMVIIDKVQQEIEDSDELVTTVYGSQGQQKTEVNPLLPHYDKAQRTLLMQMEALGLTYTATPSKITENTKKGGTDHDRLAGLLDGMNEIE